MYDSTVLEVGKHNCQKMCSYLSIHMYKNAELWCIFGDVGRGYSGVCKYNRSSIWEPRFVKGEMDIPGKFIDQCCNCDLLQA